MSAVMATPLAQFNPPPPVVPPPTAAAAAAAAATQADRLAAGPQLNPTQPPWVRAGQTPDRPRWPRRQAHFSIPLPPGIALARFPALDTIEQGLVNDFLRRLQQAYPHGTGQDELGPKIIPGEVSSPTPTARQGLFEHTRTGNQRWIGGMRLQEYSLACTEAAAALRAPLGTLILVASRQTPEQLQHWTPVARWIASLPPGQRVGAVGRWQAAGNTPSADVWHNTVVFCIRVRQGDLPDRAHNGGAGGDLERTYVYDPSWRNASPGATVGPAAYAAQHGHSRIGQYIFLGNARELVYTCISSGARAWAGRNGNVFLGGGGNLAGLDECRRMACVWMAQTAWLTREFHRARVAALASPGLLAAYHASLAEFEDWFSGFEELRR